MVGLIFCLTLVIAYKIWWLNKIARYQNVLIEGISDDLFDIKKYLGLRTKQRTHKQSEDEMDVFVGKQIREGKSPEQAAKPLKQLGQKMYERALETAKTYDQWRNEWIDDRKKANKPTSSSDYDVSYNELWRSKILYNPDAILADETYLEQKISDLENRLVK